MQALIFNRKFLWLSLVLTLIFGSLVVLQDLYHSENSVSVMVNEYVADFSNDQALIGAAHNVFIAKVLRIKGSENRGFGPETQVEVEVVDNIKGNLRGVVTVNQEGGYEKGVLYVVADDASGISKKPQEYLLQPGSTYLLATRYSAQNNWYTLISYPSAKQLVTHDPVDSEADLKSQANHDARVQALKSEYANEILLDADVKHNNALNSYVSVQAAGPDVPDATVVLHQTQVAAAAQAEVSTEKTSAGEGSAEPLQSGQ